MMDLLPTEGDGDIDREFVKDVEKKIVTEAPTHAWMYPHPGDLVSVELLPLDGGSGGEVRSWVIGSGVPHIVAGVDIDRCARTMRRGEVCSVRLRQAGPEVQAVQLRLRGLECVEDLVGDGRLVRTTIDRGSSYQALRAGTEVRIRYSWRQVLDDDVTGEAPPAPPELTEITAPSSIADEDWSTLLDSRELADLSREILRSRGGGAGGGGGGSADCAGSAGCGTVLVRRRTESDGEGAGGGLRIERGGARLFSCPLSLSPALAAAARLAALGPEAASAGGSAARSRSPPSEAVVRVIDEATAVCGAEDWLPGDPGLRVLTGLAAGSRCLALAAPALAFGDEGLPERGVPSAAKLEYDVEVLQVTQLEDISLDKRGGVMKKTLKPGEGVERPTEGTEVRLKIEALDGRSGAVLLEEREVTFRPGLGEYCAAIEECALTMAKGEVCELQCRDSGACADTDLGLCIPGDAAGDSASSMAGAPALTLSLELVDFDKLDIFTLEEAKRVAHCTSLKEAGSKLLGKSETRRALKRYQYVTNVLAYLDHWKDEAAKAEALVLRRACHLNSSLCLLRVEAWEQAAYAAEFVRQEEPDNVKALFREGRALSELGQHREAEQLLRRVMELDSTNREAAKLLAKVHKEVLSENRQAKAMFSRMAKGIGGEAEGGEGVSPASASAASPAGAPPHGAAASEASASAPAQAQAAPKARDGGGGGGGREAAEEEDDDGGPLFESSTTVALLVAGAATLAIAAVLFSRFRGRQGDVHYKWTS